MLVGCTTIWLISDLFPKKLVKFELWKNFIILHLSVKNWTKKRNLKLFRPRNFRKMAKTKFKFKSGISAWKMKNRIIYIFMIHYEFAQVLLWIRICVGVIMYEFWLIAWAKKIVFRSVLVTLKNMITKISRASNFSNFLGIKSEINHLIRSEFQKLFEINRFRKTRKNHYKIWQLVSNAERCI